MSLASSADTSSVATISPLTNVEYSSPRGLGRCLVHAADEPVVLDYLPEDVAGEDALRAVRQLDVPRYGETGQLLEQPSNESTGRERGNRALDDDQVAWLHVRCDRADRGLDVGEIGHLPLRVDRGGHRDDEHVPRAGLGACRDVALNHWVREQVVQLLLVDQKCPVVDRVDQVLANVHPNDQVTTSSPHECRRQADVAGADDDDLRQCAVLARLVWHQPCSSQKLCTRLQSARSATRTGRAL